MSVLQVGQQLKLRVLIFSVMHCLAMLYFQGINAEASSAVEYLLETRYGVLAANVELHLELIML